MVITSLEQVKDIREKKPKEVSFDIAGFDDDFNSEWTQRFNHLLAECGCSSGQQYIMYASPVFLLALIALASFSSLGKPLIVGLFLGAIVVTGATGKIAGLIEKNNKLKVLTQELYSATGYIDSSNG
ncbi:hypothetical protein [Alkalitalea saponilacus]|uniref:Uncharacterized protein n=1 Tax=Alkalitalea saponilacus TaxID=889453 RepID=A0A1T5HKI6_9BACT|nr:hypothetical protein [Alkalitalea saponilacus]ASB47782.1 hypothetical protein CDL62_00755 [Alkalitalea saponilacus]SKC21208.1 hypothetical protein SAMN03080601_02385 [Alkalitalea saponilacus]